MKYDSPKNDCVGGYLFLDKGKKPPFIVKKGGIKYPISFEPC